MSGTIDRQQNTAICWIAVPQASLCPIRYKSGGEARVLPAPPPRIIALSHALLLRALVLLGRHDVLDAQVDARDLKAGHRGQALGHTSLDLLKDVRRV